VTRAGQQRGGLARKPATKKKDFDSSGENVLFYSFFILG